MEGAAKLIEAGPFGILVLVVIIFIWYLDRRDKSNQAAQEKRDLQWQQFTKELRAEDSKVVTDLATQVEKLATELVSLRKDFNEHNTWERESIGQMQSRITANERKTQPRKGSQ